MVSPLTHAVGLAAGQQVQPAANPRTVDPTVLIQKAGEISQSTSRETATKAVRDESRAPDSDEPQAEAGFAGQGRPKSGSGASGGRLIGKA